MGLSLTEMGRVLGRLSKTTVHTRLMRGRAVAAGLPSNEKAWFAQRRGDAWLTTNAKRLLSLAVRLPPYAEHVDDEDLADSLYELGESIALLSPVTTTTDSSEIAAADLPQLRVIAARLRVLMRELAHPDYSDLRSPFDPLLQDLIPLITEHEDLIRYT
ncbi:hypothetical protein GCM10014719_59220 [Planomonospora parontospora subsp. antibiotica]|nr:hypothetical protein GCM10014719_59220 [Planomonospora parontospora subsp. antibiotica]GII19264.1 hypothetical protein Ppa05_59900 [Planomonospora parontospora subsp. antibiotica]